MRVLVHVDVHPPNSSTVHCSAVPLPELSVPESERGPCLQAAKRLGIAIRGVSFHVGSGATNPHAFSDAIAAAKRAFDRWAGPTLCPVLPVL